MVLKCDDELWNKVRNLKKKKNMRYFNEAVLFLITRGLEVSDGDMG